VLVQALYVTDRGGEAGWRLRDDGRYESRRRGEDWRPVTTLDPERLLAARAAVADAGLEGVPEINAPPDLGEGEAVLWLQAALPGGTRSVAVVGHARVPEVDRLSSRITDLAAGSD
jgi:hypothetical protein